MNDPQENILKFIETSPDLTTKFYSMESRGTELTIVGTVMEPKEKDGIFKRFKKCLLINKY